jgi:hypothetical protein
VEMNSTEIAKRLAKVAEYEQGIDLVRACDRRRNEIRERVAAIGQRPSDFAGGQTPLRQQAIEDGLEAIKRLNDEVEALESEARHLDDLEPLCHNAAERCRVQAIRDAAPKAIKAIPRGIGRVREALRALDNEIAALNRDTNVVAELIALPGEAFPFDDDEAVALFQLRHEVWTTRQIAALAPPGLQLQAPGNYAKTAAMAFAWLSSQSWGIRRGPRWPPAQPDHPGPRPGRLHGDDADSTGWSS